LLDEQRLRGVKFHSLTEHIDTETPTGLARWQMIGVLGYSGGTETYPVEAWGFSPMQQITRTTGHSGSAHTVNPNQPSIDCQVIECTAALNPKMLA
jgi:hypothetical protein